MSFDEHLYEFVMSQPEAPDHRTYRRHLADLVNGMSVEVRQSYIDRREEIERSFDEWQDLNFEVLLRLGFAEDEAGVLMDKRMNSPGIRNLIRIRAKNILNPEAEKVSIEYRGDLQIPVIVREGRVGRIP